MTSPKNQLPSDALGQPVTSLFGVGPERAALLARLEIHTVGDLLLHAPRRHEDRRRVCAVADLQLQQPAVVQGRVVTRGVKWFNQHRKSIFELVLDDGTARLHCRWWNLPYLEQHFAVGDQVVAFGKPVALKPRTIDHPETEIVEDGEEASIHLHRLTPVYPLTEGLSQRWLRALIWRTLQRYAAQIPEPWVLGEPGVTAPGRPWLSRAEAVRRLHFPDAIEEVEAARRRLALDEFVELQRQVRRRRRQFETKAQAWPCRGDNHLIKPLLAGLGFRLTAAQTRVLRELRQDFGGQFPMRRLLQGDVGSGKTLVAACCALMALESGCDVALMAPTEVLAEQHFQTFQRWFGPLGVAVALRTAEAQLTADRRSSGPGASCPATLTIGTHALLTAGFAPPRLGLVMIDEQHKFGVSQREQLVRKGRYPHLLVMTATPIPRSLGLTLYGDLDISTLDESPPGRGRIRTFVRSPEKLPEVWRFIRSQLAAGRQAYVVYPRVEASDAGGLKAVTREFEQVQQKLAPFRVGLLHGRLNREAKEGVMAAFRANCVQLLLSTSLIEVGLDVPNATILLVEGAERFGLAQLHQLRGRIGRSAQEAHCILVATVKSPAARERLKILTETTDGFRIAEADLQLRGPGELLGQQQSGLPRLRFGDLVRDVELLQEARKIAAQPGFSL